MTEIKPEAGQWWVANEAKPGDTAESTAVRIEHILPNGHIVVETYPNKFFVWTHANAWHHEPRCTGWDWVVPEEPTPPANQPERLPDFLSVGQVLNHYGCGSLEQSPSSNQPDPDEWVVQDRVPPRAGVDLVCWSHWKSGEEVAAQGTWEHPQVHGYTDCFGHRLSVRCRRRDLPPVEQSTSSGYKKACEIVAALPPEQRNTLLLSGMSHNPTPRECQPLKPTADHRILGGPHDVCVMQSAESTAERSSVVQPQPAKTRVRLWISAVDGSVYFGESSRLRTDTEIHHDGEGFFVEGGQS